MRVYQRTWRRGQKVFKAWTLTLQVNGKQVRRSNLKWSRRDAQEAGAKYVLDHNLASDTRRKTFGETVKRYLAFKAGQKKRSLTDDERHLRKLRQALGERTLLREITAEAIAEYQSRRSTEISCRGRTITPGALNREIATLRHLLRLAHEWGWIGAVPKIRLAREPEGRLRFLSEEEALWLLAACRSSTYQYLYPIVVLALNTGMRRGEILGLEWDQIDFARGVVILVQTKGNRRREIPMNQAVYEVLSSRPGPREGRVFRAATVGGLRIAFERACREAKVTDFTFHDLRHTFASHLIMGGRGLTEVRELLGHRALNMTLRYSHLSPEHRREAVAILEGKFSAHSSAHGAAEVLPSVGQVCEDKGSRL